VIEGLPSTFPPLRTIDQQLPLLGTVTLVMAEGRRLMRLSRELPPDHFGALLNDYQRLLRSLFEEMGGREMEVHADTAVAAFASARQAALVAVAAQHAVATHDWPHGLRPEISVGLHSGEAGIGWIGPAVLLCEEICDVAEAGQIFMSQATAGLLEHENIGELRAEDLGIRRTRRTDAAVHVHQLIVSAARPA
jgi:class 3 adenylate cyclase